MATGTLRELWLRELQDLYAAEQNIIVALPDLISAASSTELRNALENHLQRTRIHVERLDLILKQAGAANGPGARSNSSGIESVLRAGSERIRIEGPSDVRDAAIIAAAQHVEHYEIAGYGCARTWARQLDNGHAAELLQQTLDEEGDADKELTDIAQSGINEAADAREGFRDRPQARLRYVDANDLSGADRYRDTKIRNQASEDLGKLDGFIVDASGRPFYIVVDSGGLFVGRRYVVPVGRADFRRADHLFTVDLDKDTLKRYPEFHRDAFLSMNDEEARRYEWRVLEAIDPEAARASVDEWDYERFPYYREPRWYEPDVFTPSDRGVSTPAGASRARQTPVAEREERERVLAREEQSQRSPDASRPMSERIRGTSDDDR